MSAHPYLDGLLDHTRLFVRRFVVLGERELDAVALWNAHTYVYYCARATPYLHPHSPEPGSGKTTLLDVLELTAREAVQADGLSEAALFRLVSKLHPTLLFDEVDAVFNKKNNDGTEGIRQVLNSGYRKGKKVWRCVPPTHDVQSFDVYCAKATAGLKELPETLAHRSIPIGMKPPLPTDAYEELDPEDVEEEAEILRRNLHSWADESQELLRDPARKPAKLIQLDARGNEIWRILFRIADQAGGNWPTRSRAAAVALSGGSRRQQDTSAAVQLLAHIRDLFPDERMSCATLAEALNSEELFPYGGWNDRKGITTRELGKKLAPFGVLAKKIRVGDKTLNGYERDQFEDAWSRYLAQNPLSNRNTGTTHYPSQEQAPANRNTDPPVPVFESAANQHEQSDVPVVPLQEPGRRGRGRARLGGRGYAMQCERAFAGGHLTEAELLEMTLLDRLVRRDRDRPEEPPPLSDDEVEAIAATLENDEEAGE
jgi:hypothetical protein